MLNRRLDEVMLNEVLLVDDDDITLMLCEAVISHTKFARKVTKTSNGLEAIDFFDKLQREKKQVPDNKIPELVLLDINMPGMDGWEFLETFEKQFGTLFPELKIYILTSSVDPLDFSHSKIHANVIGFLQKPLTSESIHEIRSNEQLGHFFCSN